MKKLLFYAETLSQWSVLQPLVIDLRQYELDVLRGSAVPTNVHVSRFHPLFAGSAAPSTGFGLKRRFLSEFNYSLYRTFRALFKQRIDHHNKMLQRFRPDAVFVGEDGISGELWLVHAAKQLGIPVVILPYEASGKEDFINVLRQKARENDLIDFSEVQQEHLRSIGAEAWLTEFEGANTGIYRVEYITALHDVGIRLPKPWTTHGGQADYLLSESAGMSAHYLKEGLSTAKIKQTGSPYDDAVHAAIMKDPAARSAFENVQPISTDGARVLLSLPPDYHADRGELSEFESYDRMRDTLISEFSDNGAKLTIMVHPAYFDQARSAGDETAARFSGRWVLEEIAQHDIFVTCGSSTLRWAAAAKKVAVNFDFYKFRLEFFDRLPGLRQFEDGASCFSYVKSLTGDHGAMKAQMDLAASGSSDWAYFDGGCNARIEHFIRDLVS